MGTGLTRLSPLSSLLGSGGLLGDLLSGLGGDLLDGGNLLGSGGGDLLDDLNGLESQ